MPKCPYATEPALVILSDGMERRVIYMAAALRRIEKGLRALGPDHTTVDSLAVVLFEGLMDRDGIENVEDIVNLIDARAIPYLNSELAKVLPAQTNPLDPASAG